MTDLDRLREHVRDLFDAQAERAGLANVGGEALVARALEARRPAARRRRWAPAMAALLAGLGVVGALAATGHLFGGSAPARHQPQPAAHVPHVTLPAGGITVPTLVSATMYPDGAGWTIESGGAQAVIHTTDGSNWTAVRPAGADSRLVATGPDEAYLMTGGGHYDPSGALIPPGPIRIAHTTDGGAHWTVADGPPARQTDQVFGFWDRLRAWFFDESGSVNSAGSPPPRGLVFDVYTTADGGATWTLAGSSDGSFQLVPASCSEGFGPPALTAGPPGVLFAAVGCPGRPYLWRSADYGRTWQQAALPVPADAPALPGIPPNFAMEGPVFWSPTDGAMPVAGGFGTGGGPLPSDWVYVTHDGGRSWAVHDAPSTGTADVHLGDPMWSVVIAYPYGKNPSQSPVGVLYESHDEGATWTQVAEDARIDSTIDFASATSAWAGFVPAGGESLASGLVLYRSQDGGRSWTAVPQHLPTGAPTVPSKVATFLRGALSRTITLVLPRIPEAWTAALTTDGNGFDVLYRSPDGAQSVEVKLPADHMGNGPQGMTQRVVTFRSDQGAVYQVDTPSLSVSDQQLFWTEPGSRRPTYGSSGSLDYEILTVGMTQREFTTLAGTVAAVPG